MYSAIFWVREELSRSIQGVVKEYLKILPLIFSKVFKTETD
jgi:hypothetical protein